jgi:hypothetical protein
MKKLFIISFTTLCVYLAAYNFYSPVWRWQNINTAESPIKFSQQRIIDNSIHVWQDSTLISSEFYEVDTEAGEISFQQDIGFVRLEYAIYPQELLQEYAVYKSQPITNNKKIQIKKPFLEEIYDDTQLNITGNKTFKISVANNQDFTLDQSLFLKIDGKLGENLFITAQLTDSQSPITPEGDTREISNLDKVYLRLYGQKYGISFGDLEASFHNTHFINFQTRFEGLKAEWLGKNKAMAALAVSKGKQTTNTFNGIEGKQGPYYLSAKNMNGVQVVSGSENVFLNGKQMQRGSDYTIDYAEGSITFTNQHFINSNSFIQVDFQYSDEEYRQNMYLAATELDTSTLGISERLKLNSHIIIQNNDKDNPLQQSFTESDKEALQAAGDDEVWVSGVTQVEPGTGLYIQVQQADEVYYQYVGSEGEGDFNIHFSYVGSGGDYEPADEGYVYVGENQGTYLPIKQLVPPQFQANYDFALSYQHNWWQLNMESLLSNFDKNTFSEVDDGDNFGLATYTDLQILPNWDKLNPHLTLAFRRTEDNLETFAPLTSAIQNYQLNSLPDSLTVNEYELDLQADILNQLQPAINLQYKDAQKVTQKYVNSKLSSRQRFYLPKLEYDFLTWQQHYKDNNLNISGANQIELLQHNIKTTYDWEKIVWNAGYFYKKKTNDSASLEYNGEKQNNWNSRISYTDDNKFSVSVHWTKETTDSLNTVWKNKLQANTYGFQTFWNTQSHQINIDLARRDTHKDTYDMAEIRLSNSLWNDALASNMDYSLQNVEFYPKQRELVYVGEEYGLYDSTGTYAEDGEYIWEITQVDYDNPQLSIEVNANFNLYLKPAKVTNSFWRRFEAETNLLVSENSKSTHKTSVYLLQPEYLMQPNSTLYGKTNFYQTVWLDIWHRKLTGKIAYQHQKSLDNRYQNREESLLSEWETSLRSRFISGHDIELSYFKSKEEDSYYNSDISAHSLNLDIRSKLRTQFILNTAINYDREAGENRLEDEDYTLKSWDVSENITYFGNQKYRFVARLSYRRNWRDGSSFLGYLPEKREGDIWKWKASWNYQINSYTSTNLEYTGESFPNQKDKHELQVELKAEF